MVHKTRVNLLSVVSCNNLKDVSEMHKGGDGDADEKKVEGAHHVPHVCRMMTIKYIILKEKKKIYSQ